jgi:serine/threonine protein phosphatase 1
MEDLLTFAIGDVHGCFDKLEALLLACDRVRAGREARYVFIGDYIDRGPDARKVIDLLRHKQLSEGSRFVCLRGNHEQMLIGAAAEGRSDRDLMTWWANGGEQTLDSYGVNDPSSPAIWNQGSQFSSLARRALRRSTHFESSRMAGDAASAAQDATEM